MWVKNQWTPPLQRFYYQFLMKAFSNLDGIMQGKLDKLNHCLMYMECTTITDLANSQGKHIPDS